MFEQVGAGLLRQAIAHLTTLTAVVRMALAIGRMDYGVATRGP
jgi:hypothetical protein